MAKIIIDGIEVKKIAVVVEGYTGNTSGNTSGETLQPNWFEFEWDTTQTDSVGYTLNNQTFEAYTSPVRVNVTELVGELTQFSFLQWDYRNQYITKIVQLPDLSKVKTLENAFQQLTGLEDRTIDLSNQDLSRVTKFDNCFLDYSVFEGDGFIFDFTNTILPDLNMINTFQMFANCPSYNGAISMVVMNGQTLEKTIKMEELFCSSYANSNNTVINTGYTPNEKVEIEGDHKIIVMGNNYTLAARDEWRTANGAVEMWSTEYILPWGTVAHTSTEYVKDNNNLEYTYIYDENETGRREVTVNVNEYHIHKYLGSFTYTQVAEGEEVPTITWHQLTWDTPKDQPIRIIKVKTNVHNNAGSSYFAAFYPYIPTADEWINAQWYSVSTESGGWYDDNNRFNLNQSVEEEILVFSKDVYWTGQEENAPVDAIQYGIIESN